MGKSLVIFLITFFAITTSHCFADELEQLCNQNPTKVNDLADELVTHYVCATEKDFLACSLFAGLTLGEARGQTKFVSNVKAYEKSVRMHQRRITALAHAAFEKYPAEFPGLNHDLINELIHHDKAKLEGGNSKKLFEFYGKNAETLEGQEKRRLTQIITEVNRRDTEIIHEVMSKHGLLDSKGKPTQAGRSFLKLESIVDKVDRSKHIGTTEELGRPSRPAAMYLEDDNMKKIAAHLESKYEKILAGLAPKPLSHFSFNKKANIELAKKTLRVSIKYFPIVTLLDTAYQSMGPGNAGCSTLFDRYVDHEAGSCKPIQDLTPNFLKFLSQDSKIRGELIAHNAQLCDHVVNVYKKVRQPENWKTQCLQSNGFNVATQNGTYHVTTKNDQILKISKLGKSVFYNSEGLPFKTCLSQNQDVHSCNFSVLLERVHDGSIRFLDQNKPVTNLKPYAESSKYVEEVSSLNYLFLESIKYCQDKSSLPQQRVVYFERQNSNEFVPLASADKVHGKIH